MFEEAIASENKRRFNIYTIYITQKHDLAKIVFRNKLYLLIRLTILILNIYRHGGTAAFYTYGSNVIKYILSGLKIYFTFTSHNYAAKDNHSITYRPRYF